MRGILSARAGCCLGSAIVSDGDGVQWRDWK
jgi:hypothetical protein